MTTGDTTKNSNENIENEKKKKKIIENIENEKNKKKIIENEKKASILSQKNNIFSNKGTFPKPNMKMNKKPTFRKSLSGKS